MNRFARPLFLLALGLAVTPSAWAQLAMPGAPTGTGGIATGQRHGGSAPTVRPADPAALPGAQSRQGGAAPAARPPSTLGPTDALFDAVNRGDITSARDAVSRGADMNEHNLLGLTPLELAVDLGHNDIAFLLLSLRGTEPGAKGGNKPAGKPTPPPAPVVARASPPPVAAAKAPVRAEPSHYATDGGTPNPNAGFLGFNNGR